VPLDAARDPEVIGVFDLAQMLRRAVERATGHVWVEGEVASLRRVASGHVYFCLKDERQEAAVDCVMYRLEAQRALRHLADGARVQLYGRGTLWVPRGRLQFVAQAARPAGRGALLAQLEALKERLRAEGLFDPSRKRPLPREPRRVGIVTSRHGAALHDLIAVAHRRASVHLILSPAQVQGDGAVQSLVAALDRLERHPGLDVIVIGRGGGSQEDLMAFNDERLVRRVAAARVPIVSAVGHEIDVTLTDLVADARAATPSHAAELAVPDDAARLEALLRCQAHLIRAMRARLSEDRAIVLQLRQQLADPRFVIAGKQQLLDELALQLERCLKRVLSRGHADVNALIIRLQSRHPRAVLAAAQARLSPLSVRLAASARKRLATSSARLASLTAELDALSPLQVLGRGYAIARLRDGRVVRSAHEVRPGDALVVRLQRGQVDTVVRAATVDVEAS
jgi:exodeoxyribonuclease VII large subunit